MAIFITWLGRDVLSVMGRCSRGVDVPARDTHPYCSDLIGSICYTFVLCSDSLGRTLSDREGSVSFWVEPHG